MNHTLHSFIANHRQELIDLSVQRLKEERPNESQRDLCERFPGYVDEVVRALRRHAGLPSESPLPGHSEVAAQLGEERQHMGLGISSVSDCFGALSSAVGTLGSREGMTFSADEYGVFNACVDAAIASGIERYLEATQEERERDTAKFVGSLAHELRNELWSARMAFGNLKAGHVGINSKTADVLGRSLARMHDLIAQTMVAVQLEAGVEPHPQQVSVASLLDELQAASFPPRGITFEVQTERPLMVEADPGVLTAALSNLVQNALKYTRAAGHVVVRGRSHQSHVIIEVEDECGGLPPGRAEELFKPFVKRGEDRRGLGLGLSITREAITKAGGEIQVRNLAPKGCAFTILLPIAQGDARQASGDSH